jgi:4-alpha-glucanotransferase
MALRKEFCALCWTEWDAPVARRDPAALSVYRQKLAAEIEYQIFLQYLFHTQWQQLKNYVNNLGIKIIGDIPLFVAHDSADVWVNPSLFALDKKGDPAHVAGVPPDYFSETGQLWGNPLYRWDVMAQDDYLWWRKRLQTLLNLTDIVRIDHFRGFEAYWEIPAEAETAVNGRWVTGPGAAFFAKIKEYLGDIPLIAEDLGVITNAVKKLKNRFDLPGMKILQFCFGNGDDIAPEFPHNCGKKTVAYTGTHDNNTLLDWWQETDKTDPHLSSIIKNHLKSLIANYSEEMSNTEICSLLAELVYTSTADTVILPLQDILFLDKKARLNTPGTVGGSNWVWRFSPVDLTADVMNRLKNWTVASGRA